MNDAGGRIIAEGLKGNCSVTCVDLVSAGLLLVRLLLLTCVEQGDNRDMSDAVKQEVKAITKRNESEREQRSAEVAAFKQVFCSLMPCFCIITSLLCVMVMPAVLESFNATQVTPSSSLYSPCRAEIRFAHVQCACCRL